MNDTRRSYRILLIAEAANPEWASVPLVGWSLYQALAKVAHVHLVTQVRNRDALVRTGLVEGKDFTSVDNEWLASPLYKLATVLRGGAQKGWTLNTAFQSIVYYSFEQTLWRKFRKRLVAHEFDLVHRVTPLSPTSQSIIAKRLAKINVPFILGPLNGGVPWPRHFGSVRQAEREWLSIIRQIYKLMPGYRPTRQNSAAIIVGSQYTKNDMPRWAHAKCIYIPENGVDLKRFSLPRNRSANFPLRGAFVGRLVPYKGADILVEAAAEFVKSGKLELHIIGEGPQRLLLEKLIDRLDIRGSVHLHGWVPHLEVQKQLRLCDFLALPSVREFGGGVVLEAMALGVAPIVADYAGPAELIDDKTGISIPFTNRQSLVDGLRQTIRDLLQQPTLLDALGAAGRTRIHEHFTWEAKAKQIAEVYDAVINHSMQLDSLG